jgi:hypothetical protein
MPEHTHTRPAPRGVGDWENEGGRVALAPDAPLPPGIVSIPVTQFAVGRYRYTQLSDALAEHSRQLARAGLPGS